MVTIKGEVNLTHVQIYPGMPTHHGHSWQFTKVFFILY